MVILNVNMILINLKKVLPICQPSHTAQICHTSCGSPVAQRWLRGAERYQLSGFHPLKSFKNKHNKINVTLDGRLRKGKNDRMTDEMGLFQTILINIYIFKVTVTKLQWYVLFLFKRDKFNFITAAHCCSRMEVSRQRLTRSRYKVQISLPLLNWQHLHHPAVSSSSFFQTNT